MKNYADFYQKITAPLLRRPTLKKLVLSFNSLYTKVMYVLYPIFICYLIFSDSLGKAAPFVLIPGVSFVLLSIIRKIINQQRPYEKWDISPLIAKDSLGQSMPSRHVFSATIISMCFLRVFPILGVLCLLFSAILAATRVLGGVHYPKDVLVGYAVGVLCGALLFFI